MSWKDRLQPAAITTPDGKRYEYQYQAVEKTIRNKTSKFTFSDRPGSKVQNFGVGEVSIPLTMYFAGGDYDLTARDFEKSAALPGYCILEHPMYGVLNIVIEELSRVDDLVARGNQAVFTLTITETIIDDIPASDKKALNTALSGIDNSGAIIGENYQAKYNSAVLREQAKTRFADFVDDLAERFEAVKKVSDDINTAAQEAEDYITSNIDDLLGVPSTLIQSINTLIRIPARSTASVTARVSAYVSTIRSTIDSITGTVADVFNRREEAQGIITSCLSSTAEALLSPADGDYLKKSDITSQINTLTSLYYEVQNYLDEQEQSSVTAGLAYRYSVPSELINNIRNIISQTNGYLLKLCMNLKQERRITTTQVWDIVTLCYKLYSGKVDDYLDFFIDTNELTGDELINIPVGREIVYYV
jgi:predicted RNA-binding protein Jag